MSARQDAEAWRKVGEILAKAAPIDLNKLRAEAVKQDPEWAAKWMR